MGFDPGIGLLSVIDERVSGRIDLIKHKINDHARNRHVEPERQSNPCDTSVAREVLSQSAIERKRDKWNNHDCEDRVSCQDREVNGPREAGALKARRAVEVVIRQIRNEKE